MDKHVTVYMPIDMHAQIKQLADSEARSVTAQVVYMIKQVMNKDEGENNVVSK